jgi:transposase
MRPKGTLAELEAIHREAARAVKAGDMTIQEAAKLHAVSPRSILRWQARYDWINVNRENIVHYQGRKPALSKEQLLAISEKSHRK